MSIIGLGVAVTAPRLITSKVYSAGLLQGAALVSDTTNQGCKAPSGAHVGGFLGVLAPQQLAAGTASGDVIELQIEGVALCLCAANATITFGDEVVINGTDGSLRTYAGATDEGASVIGKSLQTITAGASAQPFAVLLAPYTVHQTNA